MKHLNISGNGKAGNAAQPQPSFFEQIILNPREMVVHAVPGTGIPMRDYFAAKAMQTISGFDDDADNFSALARDAYRMADAMLKARAGNDSLNDSQFHEDHMKPLGK